MALPERLKGKTVRELREIARHDVSEFVEEFGPVTYPINITELARAAGAEVFLAQLGDDVYGMIEGNPGGATIYVDYDSAPNRQRFTIAHELGHMVSYKDDSAFADYVDARSDTGQGSAAEIYANEFAGELLMPSSKLRSMVERNLDGFWIAEEFGVSMAAVNYRRRILGI